ncbi:MAG: ABC transporter ATP-binding protein [Myxococcales bacterium]|nr:ABC transporter ATP-binding protein [Myxococcales bacterium]
MSEPLLEVRDLCTEFSTEEGVVRAVDGVSFRVDRGEIVGLVGESGCGKSVTSLSVLGLLPKPQGRIAGGSVRFEGRELSALAEAGLRRIRGNRVAMIFQDPMTSLNPYLTVGEQIAEVGELHQGLSRREARKRAVALLERVGIPDPALRAGAYPHELSGGMRQRAMIAMALLCDPDLLIADEPTTALDVTIQAQILDLLRELRRERSMAIVLITHDLAVIAGTCDRVLVMYAGRIVESAPAAPLFHSPAHPYTRALLRSVPRIGGAARRRLETIEGLPPRLDAGPFGECRFAPRCRFVRDLCRNGEPSLAEIEPGRARRCVVPPEELR